MRISAIPSSVALSLLCVLPASLPAVQSSGGQTVSTSTWDSGAVTPWDYVGSIVGTSGVYLGNYGGEHWVLTAAHVGSNTFRLGGYAYNAVADSVVTINGVDGDVHQPDIVLFRITPRNENGAAYLDTLAILELVDTPLAVSSEVRLIGFGDGNGSAVIKSWGDNTIAGIADYTIKNTNYGGVGYYTLDSTGVKGVTGDSGGGMFYWTGESWALAGIMSAAGDLGDLGGNGLLTVALDAYADQILAIVPEPTTLAALAGLFALASVLVGRRRNRG